MEFQDYYKVLGVPRDADPAAIKKAYRKLALEWHPDRHRGDDEEAAEARFKQINEAYEVLSDAEKRKRYDRFGKDWEHGQEFTPPGGARTMSREEFESMFGGESGFSDFFTSMFGDQFRSAFGGGGRRPHARYRHRGADSRAELRLTVDDAVRGGKSRFTLPTHVPCSLCGGVGFLRDHVCPTCGGTGSVHEQRTVDLTIPRNARDGMALRLAGLGEPGVEGAEAGDLILTLRLDPGRRFRLVGANLETDVAVTPWDALFGTEVDVETPDGTVVLKIPAGTKAGRRLRLRGKGLGDASGGRGDLHAVVRYELPEELTERQRELLRELRDATARSGGAS